MQDWVEYDTVRLCDTSGVHLKYRVSLPSHDGPGCVTEQPVPDRSHITAWLDASLDGDTFPV